MEQILDANNGDYRLSADGKSFKLMRNLREDEAEAFARALAEMRQLTTLELTFSSIGRWHGVFARVARAISVLGNLTCLNLSYCDLGAREIGLLARALLRLPSLVNLNLGDNYMDIDAVFYLARALPHLPALATLSLKHNYIESCSARVISRAIHKCTALTTVDLDLNRIRCPDADPGMQAIERILERNRHNARMCTLSLRARCYEALESSPTGARASLKRVMPEHTVERLFECHGHEKRQRR